MRLGSPWALGGMGPSPAQCQSQKRNASHISTPLHPGARSHAVALASLVEAWSRHGAGELPAPTSSPGSRPHLCCRLSSPVVLSLSLLQPPFSSGVLCADVWCVVCVVVCGVRVPLATSAPAHLALAVSCRVRQQLATTTAQSIKTDGRPVATASNISP